MAKLSKDKMTADLINHYSSDASVRDALIPQIRAEMQRHNDALGIGTIDWAFMRLPDSLLAQHPQVYFERLMTIWFDYHGYDWVREQYNNNFKSKVVA